MRKEIRKGIIALFLILGLFSIATAQRITQTGVLRGTVVDTENTPLPGVNVTATSPALMLPQLTDVTDEKGFFRIVELPPGIYKIVFELSGFKTIIRERLDINPARTTTLNIVMEQSPVEETVTVVGEAPTVDLKSTSLTVNLDSEFLANIPTARDFYNVIGLAPGVVDAGADGGGYSHGSSIRDNSYILDGVNINDPVVGTFASGIGYDIAEEYSIETGGHSAEYGAVRGAVMNVITKSGGNEFNGQLSFYFRNIDLQSDNTKGTPFEDQFVGFNKEYDVAGQLGGPIVKDKLWFFMNYSHLRSENFVEDYPADKDENTPVDYRRTYPYLKFSWQIDPSMKFVTSLTVTDEGSDHLYAAWYQTEDTTWLYDLRSYSANFQYSYVISDNLIVNAKAGYLDYDLNFEPKNDKPYYYEILTGQISGSNGYAEFYDRNRIQFLADATYYLDDFYGNHEWKLGIEYSYVRAQYQVVENKDPITGIGPYIYTLAGVPFVMSAYEDHTNLNKGTLFGGYIQDTWSPIKRLTINLGLRIDHSEGWLPPQGQDRPREENRVPQKIELLNWTTLSPRIGINFDITGDGKTIIKANYGRYPLAFITDYIWGLNPNGGVNRQYWLNSDGTLGPLFYTWSHAAGRMDPDIKSPTLDELIIGIQREIIPDLSLSASFIRKWDRNLIEDVADSLDLDALKRGEFIWSNWEPVTTVDPFDGRTVTFYDRAPGFITESFITTNPEPAKRDYTGFEFVLNKRFSHNWQLLASYVYAKSTGLVGLGYWDVHSRSDLFDNPNVHVNIDGRFPQERRHQIKIQGSYQAPFGFIISAYYHGFSGLRYTRQINSLELGLNLRGGGQTLFAEPRGSRGLDFIHLLDLRLEKEFRFKDIFRLGIIVDGFNVFNQNTVTSVYTTSSNPSREFEEPLGIMDPRIFRVGVRIRW
jgi:hypothetical protein